MIGRRLVNGVESSAISVDDRGLQYGDGLFETMAATNGRVRNFARHMERLADGGRRLGLPVPDPNLIANECERALVGLGAGSVKLIVTRGPGPRSYRPPAEPSVTRIVVSSEPKPRNAWVMRMIADCLNNLDMSLSKSVSLGGKRRIEVRLDAFNALNHTQFSGINTTANFASMGSTTVTNLASETGNRTGFGSVSGVRNARQLQLMTRFSF